MIAILGMLSGTGAVGDDSARDPGNDRVQELDALIDALANRNPPPKIISRGPERYVDFGDDYEWAEQDRVVEAFRSLVAAEGNELWSRLVEHMDDKRYSLTYEYGDDIVNATVGNLCRDLALYDLLWPYWRHLPTMKGVERQSQYWAISTPQNDLDHGLEAWAWYRSRMGDDLRKLQIEVCGWAIRDAPVLHNLPEYQLKAGVKPLTKEQKDEIAEAIKGEISILRDSKDPNVGWGILRSERLRIFTPQSAKKSKERYEQKEKARKARESEKK
jgi:hypothetical protein